MIAEREIAGSPATGASIRTGGRALNAAVVIGLGTCSPAWLNAEAEGTAAAESSGVVAWTDAAVSTDAFRPG